MVEQVDCLQKLKDNKSDITSCDFGSNYLLAVGSSDKTVRLLEWKPGLGFVDISFSPLQGHKYGVTWVRFSPQGTMLASSSVDGTTILWNAKTGKKVHTMVQTTKCSVRRCEFTPDSTTLVTGGDDGFFCFWDLVHKSHISKHWLHNEEDSCIQGLGISPDSEYLLTGDSNGLFKLWCIKKIKLSNSQPKHICKNVHDGLESCEFSPYFDITGSDAITYKYCLGTCGSDGLIKLWNIVILRKPKQFPANDIISCDMFVVRVLEGHVNDVLNIRFSLNGTLIASAGLDKTVKLWKVQTGECIRNFVGHSRYVNCCAFSKNSVLLASGSNDKTVAIWDFNGKFSLDSELNKMCRRGSHFGVTGSLRLLAEEMVIHKSESRNSDIKLIQTLSMTAGVNTIHMYDSYLLATAGGDKTISLWMRKNKDSQFVIKDVLEGHKYSINQVEISPCGTKLISCSMNGVIIFWDLRIGLTYELSCSDCVNSVRTTRFSPNSEFIASAGDDQKVFLWDAKNLEFIKCIQEHRDAVTSVAFSFDSALLSSTCCAGDLKIYDLEGDKFYAAKDNIHDLGALCCDFSYQTQPRGKNIEKSYILATCGNDSLIKIWNITQNKIFQQQVLSNHGGNVNYVRFSPETNHLLVSCSTDCTSRVWNIDTGECLHVFNNHESIVTTCTFSNDSTVFVTGSLDKSIALWSFPKESYWLGADFIPNSKKLLQHWSTHDIVKWFSELGFPEVAEKVKNTTLNGQQLLGLKINDILNLIGLEGENRKIIGLHIYWAKNNTRRSSDTQLINNAPHQFLCPITHEIMSDPVICSDGFTYERGAIIEWLLCGKYTSPMTNEPLKDLKFIPNISLKTDILKYLYGENITDEMNPLSFQ